MKRILALLLCSLMVQVGMAQTNEVKKVEPNVTICEAMFVLVAVGVGTSIILYIYGKCPNAHSRVMIYLDESKDGKASWTCIATNGPVVLNGTDPLELFQTEMRSDLSFYRARVGNVP